MNVSILGVVVIASLSSVAAVIPITPTPVTKLGTSPMDEPKEEAIAPQSPVSEAIAEVSHYNGAGLILNGEALPWGQESIPIEVGDTIAIGSGYSEFGLHVPDEGALVWRVDIFPGDSLASVDLGDYYVSTEDPISEIITLSSVRGDTIAYGYDSEQPNPVVLTLLDKESNPSTETPPVLEQ